jgi:hypothetical protein
MSPIQSEFSTDWVPEPPPARPVRRKRARRVFTRYFMTFAGGIVTVLAWQSYGDAARQIIANSYPRLAWLAPQTASAQTAPATVVPPVVSPDSQGIKTISVDLAEVSRQLDAVQERMTTRLADVSHKVDQLAAAQGEMTRQIAKLQAVEQYVLYKNPEAPTRLTPAPAATPAHNSGGR